MRKEPQMVKEATVTIDNLCQTERVIKMIGSREESRGERDRVRKVVRLVLDRIISSKLLLVDKLGRVLWLIPPNHKENLATPTNNMSKLQKEAHKEQV